MAFRPGRQRQRAWRFSEMLASSAFECGSETRATPAFLYGEETPRAVALLKGSDRKILSCRVHFVANIVGKVRIVILSVHIWLTKVQTSFFRVKSQTD